jgi:hypothetical protein
VMEAKREETRLRRLTVLITCSAEGRPIPPLDRRLRREDESGRLSGSE